MSRKAPPTSEQLGKAISPRIRAFLDRIAEAALSDVLRDLEAKKGRKAA